MTTTPTNFLTAPLYYNITITTTNNHEFCIRTQGAPTAHSETFAFYPEIIPHSRAALACLSERNFFHPSCFYGSGIFSVFFGRPIFLFISTDAAFD